MFLRFPRIFHHFVAVFIFFLPFFHLYLLTFYRCFQVFTSISTDFVLFSFLFFHNFIVVITTFYHFVHLLYMFPSFSSILHSLIFSYFVPLLFLLALTFLELEFFKAVFRLHFLWFHFLDHYYQNCLFCPHFGSPSYFAPTFLWSLVLIVFRAHYSGVNLDLILFDSKKAPVFCQFFFGSSNYLLFCDLWFGSFLLSLNPLSLQLFLNSIFLGYSRGSQFVWNVNLIRSLKKKENCQNSLLWIRGVKWMRWR